MVAGGFPPPSTARASDVVGFTVGGNPSRAVPWEESMGLQAVADDTVDADARIFDSPDYQRQLLLPGPAEDGFVLELKDRTVRRLPAVAIDWTPEGLPVPDLAKGVDAGGFFLLEGIVEFEADAVWSIRPQPALVGAVTFDELRRQKPEYFHAAAKYRPDSTAVRTLRAVTGETRIVVFFGTWCLICKQYLPHFLRTLEAAANPRISAEYVGVTEDHRQPAELLEKHGVETTPTILVLQGGREIGRITEEPDDSVELDLALILGGR
jgi:thiol-disulfide isomerase/thioredoxin